MLQPQSPDESLMDVVGHMLADGAFVMADPDPEPGAELPDGLRVEVSFDGPRRGVVLIDAPPDLGMEIALNLGADEEAPDESSAVEALRELGNMITGALLPRLFGTETVFHLGIPTPGRMVGADEAPPVCQHEVALVSDEGHRIRVRVRFDDLSGVSP